MKLWKVLLRQAFGFILSEEMQRRKRRKPYHIPLGMGIYYYRTRRILIVLIC